MNDQKHKSEKVQGTGLLNTLIDKLPVELHLPFYKFCGPGTKLHKRLLRGDKPINQLDQACLEHDITYSKTSDQSERNQADKRLIEKAWERVKSKEASLGEKSAAWFVVNIMKAKTKMGGKLKVKTKRKIPLSKIIQSARKALKGKKIKNVNDGIKTALMAAKSVSKRYGKKNIRVPRVLPIPKRIGGALPFLIPLLAGLSAVGSLAGGVSSIAKTISDAKKAREFLNENKRHNKEVEIKLNQGKALVFKPYKNGFGLYLNPDARIINKKHQY